MAQKQELMSDSLPWQAASHLGLDPLTAVAAAGTTQATATSLTANCANVNSGTGGVIITLVRELHMIANNSGVTITIYPPVGSAINGGTVNSGITVLTGKSALVIPSGTNFMVNVSA